MSLIPSLLQTNTSIRTRARVRLHRYDRRRGRPEIEFTYTDDVRQFYPVAPAVYRQLLAAKPMYLFLNQILNAPRIRFDYVCTEAKRAIMMAGIAYELMGGFE